MGSYYGYSGSGEMNYNLSNYAPIDPLLGNDDIPSTSSQKPVKTEPRAEIQLNTEKPLSTKEMRQKIKEAPSYTPTPIFKQEEADENEEMIPIKKKRKIVENEEELEEEVEVVEIEVKPEKIAQKSAKIEPKDVELIDLVSSSDDETQTSARTQPRIPIRKSIAVKIASPPPIFNPYLSPAPISSPKKESIRSSDPVAPSDPARSPYRSSQSEKSSSEEEYRTYVEKRSKTFGLQKRESEEGSAGRSKKKSDSKRSREKSTSSEEESEDSDSAGRSKKRSRNQAGKIKTTQRSEASERSRRKSTSSEKESEDSDSAGRSTKRSRNQAGKIKTQQRSSSEEESDDSRDSMEDFIVEGSESEFSGSETSDGSWDESSDEDEGLDLRRSRKAAKKSRRSRRKSTSEGRTGRSRRSRNRAGKIRKCSSSEEESEESGRSRRRSGESMKKSGSSKRSRRKSTSSEEESEDDRRRSGPKKKPEVRKSRRMSSSEEARRRSDRESTKKSSSEGSARRSRPKNQAESRKSGRKLSSERSSRLKNPPEARKSKPKSSSDSSEARKSRPEARKSRPKSSSEDSSRSSRPKTQPEACSKPEARKSRPKDSGDFVEDDPEAKKSRRTAAEIEKAKRDKKLEAMRIREEKREKERKQQFMYVKSAHIGHWRAEEQFRTAGNANKNKLEKTRKSMEREKVAPTPISSSSSSILKRKHPSLEEEEEEEENQPSTSLKGQEKKKEEEYGSSLAPKRIAHVSSSGGTVPISTRKPPPIHKLSSHTEKMKQAYKEAEERARKAREAEAERKKKKFLTQEEMFGQKKKPTVLPPSPTVPQKRAKITVKSEPQSSPEKSTKKLVAPPVLEPFCTKIKSTCRKALMEKIFRQLVDMGKAEAAQEAQKLELEYMKNAKSDKTYQVNVLNMINNLRKQSKDLVIPVASNTVSHDQLLAGRNYSKISVGIKRTERKTYEQMTEIEKFQQISAMKSNLAEIEEYGYPIFKQELLKVEIKPTIYDINKKLWIEENEEIRTCCRCFQEFRMKNDGDVPELECRYHNKGFYRHGKGDTFRKIHNCCQTEKNTTPGCNIVKHHVFDQLFRSELQKFIHTPPPTGQNDPRSKQIYAIDCEMVYTLHGPALGRLSVVNLAGNLVLDVIVKPPTRVIDPNFEFSGLKMEQLEMAEDDLASAQQKLFKLVNSETILIGHSLESDFKAMRLMHYNVVDTSLLFKKGPLKQPLKKLSAQYLQRFIQSDNCDAQGHNSCEDAKACIDLVIFRIKNNSL
ncbi:unnamed protein product [Caenorhabditis angaria]|uniref:Exonuclease domain-containing protein n=1 Tax=Caenorhabditis angaria TaxID=860376 RepID=A0A9P1N1A2_9PELO|nr:unnamed protein product [Caenorhabditis angaria]